MQFGTQDAIAPAALLGPTQLVGFTLTLIALHLSARFSFLFFHTLVEAVRIFVLGGMFVLAWHSRRWAANSFLSVIGVAALFVAGLELLHTLTYRGMGLIPGDDANLPTQLWIAFRYLESLSYLLGAAVAHRRVDARVLLGGYGLATLGLLTLILSGRFPDCYVEGQGLTAFKIGSEYVIVGIFVASLVVLFRQRAQFDRAVLMTLGASVGAGMLAELAFTRYVSVFGFANEFGHYLLLLSAYLIYRAVLVTGVVAPFNLLFRDLKQKETELESKVVERTAALRKNQALMTAFANNSPAVIFLADLAHRYLLVNAAFERLVGRPQRGIIGKTPAALFPDEVARSAEASIRSVVDSGSSTVVTERIRGSAGERIFEAVRFPVRDERGEVVGIGGVATDVTEHRLAEERYGTLIRASMDAFVILDDSGRFVEVNDSACELTGHARERLLQMGVGDLDVAMDAGAVQARLRDTAAGGASRFDSRWQRSDGAVRDIEVSINYIAHAAGARYFGFVRDITERKEALARIEYLAHHDVLTGLPNKLLFQQRFAAVLAHAAVGGGNCALLYLDLDNFKDINDSLGHVAGDALLRQIAARLSERAGEWDAICRVGGDEFLLLLGEPGPREAVGELAAAVLAELARPIHFDEHELVSTVSMGVVLFPEHGRDFDTLFRNADTAMFQAKAAGRNAYRFFDERMNANARERLELLGKLRGAVDRGELILHYQPQLDLARGTVVGVEALIRWHHPELGLVSPARFIPLAEDSGLIVPIGAWVLREACRQAAAWQREGLPPMVMAVNLSAAQFRSAELERTVTEALRDSGLDAGCLELELTESILIGDVDVALEGVGRLKALGVQLSIDDFGTGYSSLAYLKRFAVDKLKIDQSFVRDMDHDPDDAALVMAVIQMARALGLRTVAEGVEHAHLADRLRAYGCDEAQGYYYARPMAAADCAGFISARMQQLGLVTAAGD